MNLIYFKAFLSRNDVKTFIMCTITGGILQLISKQYIKSHPEFFENRPVPKKKYRLPKFLSPRGGAFIELSGISIKIVADVVLNFLATKGLLAGVVTGGAIVIGKIPATAVSTYLQDAFPQNLPHLEKSKFILVEGEKIYLDQCDQNLQYLFKILEDKTIPYKEKKNIARSILTKYLDLKTQTGRANFILCIGFVLYILSTQNPAGCHILFTNLINAIKDGTISKKLGRAIVRKLLKQGVLVDPELLEVVKS